MWNAMRHLNGRLPNAQNKCHVVRLALKDWYSQITNFVNENGLVCNTTDSVMTLRQHGLFACDHCYGFPKQYTTKHERLWCAQRRNKIQD